MTKLIKDKINSIIYNISSKKKGTKYTQLPNNKRVVPSKDTRIDEYDYFSRMQNL